METMRVDIVDAQTVKPAYMQNIETAEAHLIRPSDSCRTMCGYEFRGPTYHNKKVYNTSCFRFFGSRKDILGAIMCDRCLPSERTLALTLDLLGAEMNADEHGE